MIKFLHTRIRVSDLEQTIQFYETLGFTLTRRTDKSPAGNQLAFLELEGNEHFLELCYSPDFEVKFPEDLIHVVVRSGRKGGDRNLARGLAGKLSVRQKDENGLRN